MIAFISGAGVIDSPFQSQAVAADRPPREVELKAGKRTVDKLTNQKLLLVGPVELTLKNAETPIVNSEVHLNHEEASVFFENLRPSQVLERYPDQLQVKGRPARDGQTAHFQAVVNGTLVVLKSRGGSPMKIYHEQRYKGKAYEYDVYKHYNLLQLRQGNDRPASFTLQQGYMVTLTEHTGAEGFTQTFVARERELTMPGMPPRLRGKVSTVHVLPWRRTTKKGAAATVEQAQLLGAHWYTTGIVETASEKETIGSSTPDLEYVPLIRSNRGVITDLLARKGMTHMLNDDTPSIPDPPAAEPDPEASATTETPAAEPVGEAPGGIDPASIDKAIAAWEPRPISGLRLGSPTLTEGNIDWVYAFLDEARSRDMQIDFVPVQVNRPDWTVAELLVWLNEINRRTGKPLWVTRFNHAAPKIDGSEPTPEQHAQHLAALCQAFDDARYIERYAVSIGEGTAALIDADGQLTPVGQAYHDHVTVEAYTERR